MYVTDKYTFYFIHVMIHVCMFFLGHDAIVTLLKHYKRPQDDSPCNEYSQPGGGMKHSPHVAWQICTVN